MIQCFQHSTLHIYVRCSTWCPADLCTFIIFCQITYFKNWGLKYLLCSRTFVRKYEQEPSTLNRLQKLSNDSAACLFKLTRPSLFRSLCSVAAFQFLTNFEWTSPTTFFHSPPFPVASLTSLTMNPLSSISASIYTNEEVCCTSCLYLKPRVYSPTPPVCPIWCN